MNYRILEVIMLVTGKYFYKSIMTQMLIEIQMTILTTDQRLEAVNNYHKELHIGCCSSPRSTSDYLHQPRIW